VDRLRACASPWCDHAAFVASTDTDMFYGKAYQVQCSQCSMGGPVKRTEAEAIDAWNVRPVEDALVEALREARLQIEYLDGRFPTGTSPAAIAKIDDALNLTKGANHGE
jgi:hypothetical protein